MELYLVKQLDNSFKVAHDCDYDKLKKLKVGKLLKCKVTQPRNVNHHRKFFSLLNLVYQNQEHYNNIEHLRKDLTVASGFYTERENIKGDIVIEPLSISFASMKQETFDIYYSKILDSVVKYFKFDKQSIIDEIEKNF